MDRECKSCVWSSGPAPGDSNGCTAWECEYINKKEAAEAWRGLKDIEGYLESQGIIKREENNGREENA